MHALFAISLIVLRRTKMLERTVLRGWVPYACPRGTGAEMKEVPLLITVRSVKRW